MSTPDPLGIYSSPPVTAPKSSSSSNVDVSRVTQPVNIISPADATAFIKQATESLSQSSAQSQKDYDAYQKTLADVQAKMAMQPSAAEIQQHEEGLMINLSKLSGPPKQEAIYKAKNFKLMLGISAAFAALGIAATHGNIAAAIDGFSGGLQGFVNGDNLRWQRGYQEWQQKNEQAIKSTELSLQAYQDVLNNNDYEISQKMQLLQILGANLKDDYILRATSANDIKAVSGLLATRTKAVENYRKQLSGFNNKVHPINGTEVKTATNSVQSILATYPGFPHFTFDQKASESRPDPNNPGVTIAGKALSEQHHEWYVAHPDYARLSDKLTSLTIHYMRAKNESSYQAAIDAISDAQSQGWFSVTAPMPAPAQPTQSSSAPSPAQAEATQPPVTVETTGIRS